MSNYKEQRKHAREPYTISLDFTVLLTQATEFQRLPATGKALDKSPAGLGLITAFPLEPGHVLQWDDQHKKGALHIAMVKWTKQMDNLYRAGLIFI